MAHAMYFRASGNMNSLIQNDDNPGAPSCTKLVCTIGPVSRDVETLKQLLKAGMTMAKFDFSYGTMEWHQEALNNLRTAMRETRTLCATVMDTLGPEIVVLNRPQEPIKLEAGQTVVLTCDPTARASSSLLPISYPSLSSAGLQPGRTIFVGQYLFTGSETTSAYLTVQSVGADSIVCVCSNSCVLEGLQLTVHIGNMKNEAPILSQRDREAIVRWAAPNSLDLVALSFTRSAADVREARAFLDSISMTKTKVVAKIENMEGLVAHKEIVEAAESVVLSRGSMGNCLDPEKMFLAQKMLLRECNLAGKSVFVTRVVDTMIDAPRPTRAEATDVANAVLDGADGIILGSETFRGKFPVAAVETVRNICRAAEACFDNFAYYNSVMDHLGAHTLHPVAFGKTEALATAAVRAASKLQAALILVHTVTGRTARLIAKYRPSQPILTVVVPVLQHDGLKWQFSGDFVARQCLQYRGVIPICADPSMGSPDGAILRSAVAYARSKGLVKTGDRVVVSQCPRRNVHNETMAEAGTVKIMTVEDEAMLGGAKAAAGVAASPLLGSQLEVFGSTDTLQDMAL